MVLGDNANVPDPGRGPGLERRPPQGWAGRPYASQGSSQALSPITQKPWALTLPLKAKDSLSPQGTVHRGTYTPAQAPSTLSSCLMPLTFVGLNMVSSDMGQKGRKVQGNPHS